jgi:hypothetical protein
VKNPRWAEDTFAIPEHNRLYEQALELYLYLPFFGSEIQAATRGLWCRRDLSTRGRSGAGTRSVRDLVSIYLTLYAQAQAHRERSTAFEEARQ